MGHGLDIVVVAEGIETAAQLDRLRSIGCKLGQGYLFSPAVPATQAGQMLK
jgi:FOG: EAL domain